MRILWLSFLRKGNLPRLAFRLALVTVMQFVEDLSDQRAADAVRGRIDWKYLLGLELTDPGFDASVLSEFRARLIEKHAEELELSKMLALFQQKGWRKRPRTPAHRFDPCARQDPRSQPGVVRMPKRCVLLSTVLRWSLQTGCVLTAIQNGWNDTALVVKIRVRLWEKRHA
jgi:hypothetical protein